MARLKRLGILFAAKLHAVVGACVGVIAGLLYAVGGAIVDLRTTGPNAGTALAFLAIVGMPVLFAAAGFLLGAVTALLYNLVAPRFGGIESDFE